MSKKAKKNNVINNKTISLMQIVLLLIAIGMIFVPAIVQINDSENLYSGFDIVFGKVVDTTVMFIQIKYTIFEISILNLIPYLIMILGIIVLLFNIKPQNKNSSKFDGILFILFVVAAILVLNAVNFTVPGKDIKDFLEIFSANINLSDYYELAVGSIITASLLFVSAFLSLIKLSVLKK